MASASDLYYDQKRSAIYGLVFLALGIGVAVTGSEFAVFSGRTALGVAVRLAILSCGMCF
jgi:hypothetical protein